MSDVLYRHRRPAGEVEMIDAASLVEMIFYHEPAGKPDHAEVPRGEWYCTNEDCVVREVTVLCKLFGERLPGMRCPACRRPLKFHHWTRLVALEPAGEAS